MNHGKGHNMIIFDFLKKLEKYVDLTMLSQLSTESVEKLTNYFNDNNIYEKMNLLHAKVKYRGKISLIKKACKEYTVYKERGTISTALKEELIIPERMTYKYDAVIFMYFLLYENNLIIKEADNEALFKTLSDVYELEYEDSIFMDLQSFALFCVLIWKQGVGELCIYLDQIADELPLYGDLENILKTKQTLTVGNFIDRIDELCMAFDTENNIRETRQSVANAIASEYKILDSFRNENNGISKPVGFIEFCQSHEDYKKIMDMILNTQSRRRWYLYRIIQKIVLKQINDIAHECETVDQVVSLTQRKRICETQMINPIVIVDEKGQLRFNELYFFECSNDYDTDFTSKEDWLKRNCTMCFDKICYIFEIMLDEKSLHVPDSEVETENRLAIARIFGKGINGWIERCLARGFSDDDIIKIAIDHSLIELPKKIDEKKLKEKKEDLKKQIDEMRIKLYERYNDLVDKRDTKDLVHGFGVRANEGLGDVFWKILIGQVDVTRELLLSFVMIAKVYFVDLKLEYIQMHILENSRFDPELDVLDGTNHFNMLFYKFYMQIDDNLYSNINMRRDFLTLLAAEMEISYLKEGIAPFTAMVEGRSLE